MITNKIAWNGKNPCKNCGFFLAEKQGGGGFYKWYGFYLGKDGIHIRAVYHLCIMTWKSEHLTYCCWHCWLAASMVNSFHVTPQLIARNRWPSQEFLHGYHMWRHLWKPSLWRDKKDRLWSDAVGSAQRLIRAWTFVTWEHLQKILFSLSAQIQKILWYINIMEIADLGKHCLLLHTGFSYITPKDYFWNLAIDFLDELFKV